MKLNSHSNALRTNVKTTGQDFGIDQQDMPVIIEILRNRLYKNKVRVIVQEYICNGRDAMREIGNTEPIKVQAPTVFKPEFSVRDFGPGITPDRMANVFCKYGASTKRDTNGQTGGFGIGAKSAWAYTDSFQITTYVDGIRREYLAHTGKGSNGRLELLEEAATDEANGTKITIAVNPDDVGKFMSQIERCLFFWPAESYQVTGLTDGGELSVEYDHDTIDNLKVYNNLPDVFCGQYNYQSKVLLLIDNIAYDVTDFDDDCNELNSLIAKTNGHLVISTGNGVFNISANREEIEKDDKNADELNKLVTGYAKKCDQRISQAFKGKTNPKEFLETYEKYKGLYSLRNITFKNGAYDFDNWRQRFKLAVTGSLRQCSFKNDKFYRKDFNHSFFTMNELKNIVYSSGTLSKVKLFERIRKYINDNADVNSVILIESDDATHKQYAKDWGAVDVATLPEPPKAPKGQRIKRSEAEVCLHTTTYENTRHVKPSEITGPLYYVPLAEFSKWKHKEIAKALDIQIVGISPTNLKKLSKKIKDFTVKPLQPVLDAWTPSADMIEAICKSLTKNSSFAKWLVNNKVELTDTKLKAFVEGIKEYKHIDFAMFGFMWNKINKNAEYKAYKKLMEESAEHINKNYQLAESNHRYQHHTDDLIVFVNAKQKTLNEGTN